jgi:hypothetical protein
LRQAKGWGAEPGPGGLNPFVQIHGVMCFEEAHLTPPVETGAPVVKDLCLSFGVVLKEEMQWECLLTPAKVLELSTDSPNL